MQYILILSIIFNCTLLIAFTAYFMKQQHLNCLTVEKACINEERYMIEIEVTESIGDVDIPQFLNACNTIRSEGFRLSLDDFGAKHSNVAILTALPFHAVKLDKSIIDHMLINERNLIVAQEFLRTCNQLGAHSVAEGVQTEEQLTKLKALGCDFVQGYYFDKPIPVTDFETKYLNANDN